MGLGEPWPEARGAAEQHRHCASAERRPRSARQLMACQLLGGERRTHRRAAQLGSLPRAATSLLGLRGVDGEGGAVRMEDLWGAGADARSSAGTCTTGVAQWEDKRWRGVAAPALGEQWATAVGSEAARGVHAGQERSSTRGDCRRGRAAHPLPAWADAGAGTAGPERVVWRHERLGRSRERQSAGCCGRGGVERGGGAAGGRVQRARRMRGAACGGGGGGSAGSGRRRRLRLVRVWRHGYRPAVEAGRRGG
jgi:hypothetical protein